MESEKTERFNGNTNETENVGEKENRLGTEKTKRFEKYPNETEKTKRFEKYPNETEKTKRGKKTMIMILIMILMVI